MNFSGLKTASSAVLKLANKNAPVILAGVAVVGVGASIYLAIKATPKAMMDIENKQDELDEEASSRGSEAPLMTKPQMIKTAWKNYIPTMIVAGGTVAAIVCGMSISVKRQAAMATAYALSASELAAIKSATDEVLTTKKRDEVYTKAAEKQLESRTYDEQANPIAVTTYGDQLFVEGITGQRFRSCAEKVRQAANEINARMIDGENSATVNEWLYTLGVDSGLNTDNIAGYSLEWNPSRYGYARSHVEPNINYTTDINTGEPVGYISYALDPQPVNS